MSDMTFNDRSTPLTLLATRRSGKPRDLIAPGPDADQLAEILRIAGRTPDHGKLAPWSFVVVAPEARGALAQVITTAYRDPRPVRPRSPRWSSSRIRHPAWSSCCRPHVPTAIFRYGSRNCRPVRPA